MAFSNKYIVGFAGAVCVVCSIFVAGSAVALRDKQETNAIVDRQKQVLTVAGLAKAGEPLEPATVQKRFSENLVPRVVDLSTGEYVDDVEAANYDMQAAMDDPDASTEAPPNDAKVARVPNLGLIYELQGEDEQLEAVILPVQGKGLWSTLKGYLAVGADGNTVKGLTFYSHAETPGLGGEVDNPKWKALWPSRKLFGEDGKPKIEVIKGQAGKVEADPYRVDGLSGATITSRGVSHLIKFWIGHEAFGPYLDKLQAKAGKGE